MSLIIILRRDCCCKLHRCSGSRIILGSGMGFFFRINFIHKETYPNTVLLLHRITFKKDEVS
jgi:hypothetical protein